MRGSTWFWMTVVGVIWLVLYFCFLMKIPVYVYMNHINLPEDCTSLETNVVITDLAYGWHIEAERLIYSRQGEEAIENYVNGHNRFSKRIMVRNFYEANNVEYDYPILIPSEKYPSKEGDAENYISVRYNSAFKGEQLWGIMSVLGIVFMVVLGWLTYWIDLRLHKKQDLQDARENGASLFYQAFFDRWR